MSTFVQILLALAPYLVPPLFALLYLIVQSTIQHMPAQQRAFVDAVVRTAVAAAEQAGVDLNGPGKKQMALEMIQKTLAHYHMSVPDVVINSLLEETVLALNSFKSVPAESTPVSK